MLPFARACWPDGTSADHDLLALHVAIIRAIDDSLEWSSHLASCSHECAALLPWLTDRGGRVLDLNPARASIRNGVGELEMALAHGGGPGTGRARRSAAGARADGAIRWWRGQAEQTLAAMWQESVWRICGSLPDEASYRRVAQSSIAVGWLAASLLLLDGASSAPRAGGRFLQASDAIAVAVRIANDLHDWEREQREGKVHALGLRAHALSAGGWEPDDAVRRARRELGVEIAGNSVRAFALLDARRWTGSLRMRAALEGMLRAALDLYVPDLRPGGFPGSPLSSARSLVPFDEQAG